MRCAPISAEAEAEAEAEAKSINLSSILVCAFGSCFYSL
ncbi:protein of unknown function [Vibrio tapetis subsp. tapetis]|uniref:Uncharacterized protein n=1 Tax=Vibrio tapetis subsp. tapetis TaxID=1671868 RepID=A0A2N8ZGC7_9VIBR|nr:protein of unknown function [Vibrio tapetis subsp. tapetis]